MNARAFRMALLLLSLSTAGHAQGGLRTVIHASGFSFPLSVVQDPSDATVQFVVEQGGRIRTIRSGSFSDRLP